MSVDIKSEKIQLPNKDQYLKTEFYLVRLDSSSEAVSEKGEVNFCPAAMFQLWVMWKHWNRFYNAALNKVPWFGEKCWECWEWWGGIGGIRKSWRRSGRSEMRGSSWKGAGCLQQTCSRFGVKKMKSIALFRFIDPQEGRQRARYRWGMQEGQEVASRHHEVIPILIPSPLHLKYLPDRRWKISVSTTGERLISATLKEIIFTVSGEKVYGGGEVIWVHSAYTAYRRHTGFWAPGRCLPLRLTGRRVKLLGRWIWCWDSWRGLSVPFHTPFGVTTW